ncbi:MAG TPA: FtsX-like permease family protein [Candidatus Scalindua sp.]|nr:FtsX-like permease family protein [Candidatus Scalindua sp.]
MTLTTARATYRAKEVAVKKVFGSGRRQLIIQYTSEAILQTFIALILGLILIQVLLPWFNVVTNKEIIVNLELWVIISAIFFSLIVGIISGLYPALYLTAFSPLLVFKSGTQSGSKAGFIKILVTFQFIISIGLIICTGYIHKQLHYIRNKDLGINKENVLIIQTSLWYDVDRYKQEILNNPNVISASASMSSPADFYWTTDDVTWEGKQTSDMTAMSEVFVDEDFAETYGLKVIKGDFISTESEDYWLTGEDSVKYKSLFSFPAVINETAWKMMGFDDPIGKRFNDNNIIVGVVKDFHFKPLQEKVMPLIIKYNPEAIFCLNIRIRPENMSQTIAYIKEIYEKHRPERGFSYSFFEDELANKYMTEQRQGKIFLYFTLLSILISSLGVFGLAVFSAARRTREIGIRKVFGGSLSRILILLIKDFSKWILVAFCLVSPLAWYTIQQWAQTFAYRTEISWWIFVLSGLLVYLIAILTVIWVSFRVADRNPVETLRNE